VELVVVVLALLEASRAKATAAVTTTTIPMPRFLARWLDARLLLEVRCNQLDF